MRCLLLCLSLVACSSDPAPPADASVVFDLGAVDAGTLIDTPAVDGGVDRPAPADTGTDAVVKDWPFVDVPIAPLDVGEDRPADGGPSPDAACALGPDSCPRGFYCPAAGQPCAAGCRGDADCDGGTHCHAPSRSCLACVTDDHCPAGTVCSQAAAPTCIAGCNAGRSCLGGLTCCSGSCVDTNTNPATCGACNRQCTVANSTAACVAGACAVGTCVAPFVNCDGNVANGCEVNTQSDRNNCGSCGHTCGDAGVCVASTCL